MTTIIGFKENGRWHLAADSRVSAGYDFDDTFEKLRRNSAVWYSISGDARLYMKMERQAPPESVFELLDQFKSKNTSGSMLATEASGKNLWLFEANGYYQEITGRNFYAIGSGTKYALGALEMGASVEEAFKIVKKYDSGTGGPVKTTRKWKR